MNKHSEVTCGYCHTRRYRKVLRKLTDREFKIHQILMHPVVYWIGATKTNNNGRFSPTRIGWKARKRLLHG